MPDVLAALALVLSCVPAPYRLAGALLAPLAAIHPLFVALPFLPAAAAHLSRWWQEELRQEAIRRQFRDLLLTITLSALDGYGVASALVQESWDTATPLGTVLARLGAALRRGDDLERALQAFTSEIPLKAAERLADAVRRERFFGVSQGETMIRQLELFHVEEEERQRRRLALLPYFFTLSVGLLFLDGAVVVFLPLVRALLHTMTTF